MIDVQVGSTITNGICAVRVTGRESGMWTGLYISFGSGDMSGVPTAIPDGDLWPWRHVPFEWAELPGSQLEHRYVWSPDWRRLQHEIRGIS
jgi:hypothetical protein